ncbi:MAG: DUF4367 domain-containing protein [Anaerotruncus sp.]|nr:DUF4367 domain-containing protein [Anaerotruncus sp.]
MRLDDDFFTRAVKQAAQQIDRPTEPTQEHLFSDHFKQEMQQLLHSQRKKSRHRPLYRAAAVVAIFLGLSASILSVDAWREQLFRMVVERHEEYSDISYESVGGKPLPESFRLTEYRPAYLPEGYLLTNQMLDDCINWSVYTNAQGLRILFDQSLNAREGFAMGSSINTEGAQLEEFELNGLPAYQMSNKGSQFILWNDEIYNYMLITDLPMSEALKIAQSVAICPADAPHPPQLTPKQLPCDYTLAQAQKDGALVVENSLAKNTEALTQFLSQVQAGEQAILRLITPTREGDLINIELYFDGWQINCTIDNTQDRFAQEPQIETRSYEAVQLRASGNDEQELALIGKDGAQQILCRFSQT